MSKLDSALIELDAILTTITATLDLDRVLSVIVESTVRLFADARGVTIHLFDKTRNLFTIHATSSEICRKEPSLEFKPGEGIAGLAAQQRRVINVSDVLSDPRFARSPIKSDLVSLLVVPLLFDDRVLGTISLKGDRPGVFEDEDERVLKLLAGYAATAIGNAQLYGQVQREVVERIQSEESIWALYEIAAQQADFATKIDELLAMGCQRFDLESGVLAHIEGNRYEIIASHSPSKQMIRGSVYDLGSTYCRETLKANSTIGFEHAGDSKWASHPAYQTFGQEAYLGTPLLVDGKVYGVLSFSSSDPLDKPFKPAGPEFLRLMAQWVGNEIERAQHTHQLQTYAKEIARKNRELSKARDQAVEVAQLKSDFLTMMSHEVRTPMNAIIGMTEMLLDTPLDDEQREFGRIIRDASQALLMILNDILDFTKIEAGELALEHVEFEPLAVVEGVADLLASKAQEKRLSLVTLVAPEIPDRLRGDLVRLRQIILNLVDNAIKFTAQGEVVIQAVIDDPIYNRQSLDPEAVAVPLDPDLPVATEYKVVLRFTVSDAGIGLSEDARRWLFQPFTQADAGTTRKYGGTGLGLAICRRLVELMGGQIGVESVEGEGSTFWFTAPFERIDPPSPRPRLATILPGRQTIDRKSTLIETPFSPDRSYEEIAVTTSQTLTAPRALILLVEDSLFNQRVARLQLEKLGYTVDTANNGHEALDAIRTERGYALVLMDCEMPQMNGFEATRAIRRWEQTNGGHVPIVAMTAHALQGEREKYLAAGMDDHISKPVKQNTLRQVLERWIRSTVEPDRAESPSPPPIMLQNLRMITGDDPTLLNEIIALFLKEAPPKLTAIRDAVVRGDAQALVQVAHSLKSGSAHMGARVMTQLCAELETLGRAGKMAKAPELVGKLAGEYEKVKTALEAESGQRSF